MNMVELALSTNRKFVPRFLIQDDRVMPYILLKISPRMAHGPPLKPQGKIEIFYVGILSVYFSHDSLFNHNPTFLAKSVYLDNKKIIILDRYCDRVSFEGRMDGFWGAVEAGSTFSVFDTASSLYHHVKSRRWPW
ncbi:MAG: hypothetical protein JSW40_00485 [Candidatus Omnitrophota bacterium]|nr:MAG: hypothetical protein JSW40_00485 [Candidatus Omnitrophota bacterium]